jgi:hypothetical protein
MKGERVILLMFIMVLSVINTNAQTRFSRAKADFPFDTANLSFWFSADSIDTLPGGLIDTLFSINNNLFAAQSSAAFQPSLYENLSELNGNNAVLFDGVNDNFVIPDNTTIQTLYIVSNWNGGQASFPDFNGLINKFTADQAPFYILMANKNSTSFYSGGGNFFGTNIIINQVQSLSYSPLGDFKLVNGFDTEPVDCADLQIGGALGYAGRYWNGYIAEIIAFKSLVSSGKHDSVITYLQNKFAPPVDLGSDTIFDNFCEQTITAEKDYFKSYEWSTEENTSSINISEPGDYSVTVTDFMGNISIDTLSVSFTKVNILFDSSICLGDSILWNTGLFSEYTYEWFGSSASDSAIYINTEGEYSVKITDTFGCSFSTDTIQILIDSFPVNNSLGNDRSVCSGTQITLVEKDEGVVSFLWNNDEITEYISVDTEGLYSLTVTNSLGCTSSDSVYMTIKGEAPQMNFISDTVCFGNYTSFLDQSSAPEPDGIFSWVWSFGNGDSAFIQNPVYTYPVVDTFNVVLTVETDSGCVNTISKEVFNKVKPTAGILVNYGDVQCVGQEINFNDNSDTILHVENYYWAFGDGVFENIASPFHIYNSAGVFSVDHALTIENGCSDTVSIDLSLNNEFPLPEKPTIHFPSDNYTFFNPDTIVHFDWLASENAVFYQITIAKDEGFAEIVIDELVDSSFYDFILQDVGKYYWTVKPLNLCYVGYVSDTLSFEFRKLSESKIQLWFDGGFNTPEHDSLVEYFINKANGDSVFQSNESFRPIVNRSDVLNENKAINFDGVDDNFIITNPIKVGSIIAIVNFEDESNVFPDFNGIVNSSIATDNSYILMGSKNSNLLYSGGGNLLGENIYINQIQDLSFSPFNQYKLIYGYTANPTEYANLKIGGAINASSAWKGNIAEVIIFDTALTQTEIDEYYDYLRYKYVPVVSLSDIQVDYGFPEVTITAADRPWFTSHQWSTGETIPFLPFL